MNHALEMFATTEERPFVNDWRAKALRGIGKSWQRSAKVRQYKRRVMEIARCCGVKVTRWRPVDGEFPGGEVQHCGGCGLRLKFQRMGKRA